MPIPGPTPYQYKPDDDPVTLAQQNGITPGQLLAANPGGYPFSPGQNINIPMLPPMVQQNFQQRGRGASAPYQYAPTSMGVSNTASLGDPSLLQQRMDIGYGYDPAQRGRGENVNQSLYDMRGRGYGQPTAVDNINDMRGRGFGQTNTPTPQTGVWEDPAASTTPNTANGDFYGYERDPETGRSVRVIKNSASSNFLSELRWDPQRRRYVSIGKLLQQGKLDLKGNWRNSGRRQRQASAIQRKQQVQQQKDDFTLSNSLISFSASAG
jgi:hypothetical protein